MAKGNRFDPKNPGPRWTWKHTVDGFRSNAGAIAIVALFAVLALVVIFSGCDSTVTITADCLYPDSVVVRDGVERTYWPEGCRP